MNHKILLLACAVAILGLGLADLALAAKEIMHDAEYYVLEAQHGRKWAREDRKLASKLRALKREHGTRPNIIHIMWDDTAVGEIGVPQQKLSPGCRK